MGTKNSFSGGGGNIGNDLRDGIDDWLDSLPGGAAGGSDTPPDSEPSEASQPGQHGPAVPGSAGSGAKPKLSLAARRVLPTAVLFKTSSGTGSSLTPRDSRPVHAVSRIEFQGGWPRRGRRVRLPDRRTPTRCESSDLTTRRYGPTRTSSTSSTRSRRRSARTCRRARSTPKNRSASSPTSPSGS